MNAQRKKGVTMAMTTMMPTLPKNIIKKNLHSAWHHLLNVSYRSIA
jgi:hypothetical protein